MDFRLNTNNANNKAIPKQANMFLSNMRSGYI